MPRTFLTKLVGSLFLHPSSKCSLEESSLCVALIQARIKLAPDSHGGLQLYTLRTAGPHITFNATLIYCGRATHLAVRHGNKGLLTQLLVINFYVTRPELFRPKQRCDLAPLLARWRAQGSACAGNPIINYMW